MVKTRLKKSFWNSVNSLKNEIDFFPKVESIVIFSNVTSQIPDVIKNKAIRINSILAKFHHFSSKQFLGGVDYIVIPEFYTP